MSKRRSLESFPAAVPLAAACGAIAWRCPPDMAKIDAALAKNPRLTDTQMAEAETCRAEGETLHEAGKRQESLDTFAEAMKILGIE